MLNVIQSPAEVKRKHYRFFRKSLSRRWAAKETLQLSGEMLGSFYHDETRITGNKSRDGREEEKE
jgi:hypothetical protein